MKNGAKFVQYLGAFQSKAVDIIKQIIDDFSKPPQYRAVKNKFNTI